MDEDKLDNLTLKERLEEFRAECIEHLGQDKDTDWLYDIVIRLTNTSMFALDSEMDREIQEAVAEIIHAFSLCFFHDLSMDRMREFLAEEKERVLSEMLIEQEMNEAINQEQDKHMKISKEVI